MPAIFHHGRDKKNDKDRHPYPIDEIEKDFECGHPGPISL
jgi:hypothetical protein